MKKIMLSLLCIFCVIILSGCNSNESKKLAKKITNENLVFVEKQKNICDTELQIENKITLRTEKDSNEKHIAEYQYYDCGDGVVYMTLSNGTYTLNDNKIKFIDQYNKEYVFTITGKDEITLIDETSKETRKFKLQVSTKEK